MHLLEHVVLETDHLGIDRDPVLGVARPDRLRVFAGKEAIVLRFCGGQGPWFTWIGVIRSATFAPGSSTSC